MRITKAFSFYFTMSMTVGTAMVADAVAAAAAATADATMVCCLLIMRIKSPLYLSFDETIYPYNAQ